MHSILSILSNVLGNININSSLPVSEPRDDSYKFDNELLDGGNEILQDDELCEMIVENVSLSQLQSFSLEEENENESCHDVMPPAVLATVETMTLD